MMKGKNVDISLCVSIHILIYLQYKYLIIYIHRFVYYFDLNYGGQVLIII